MQELYYIPQWDGQGDYKVSLSRRKDAQLMIGGGYRFDEYDFREMAYPGYRCLSRWNDFVSVLVVLRVCRAGPTGARGVLCEVSGPSCTPAKATAYYEQSSRLAFLQSTT